MPLIELWRRGVKQHFKGLSDHLEKCQFTTYGVLCPNRSCHHCKVSNFLLPRLYDYEYFVKGNFPLFCFGCFSQVDRLLAIWKTGGKTAEEYGFT